MDTRSGEVMPLEEVEYRIREGEDPVFFKQVPYQKTRPKTGRNDPCPCGSGIKFKRCCYSGYGVAEADYGRSDI